MQMQCKTSSRRHYPGVYDLVEGLTSCWELEPKEGSRVSRLWTRLDYDEASYRNVMEVPRFANLDAGLDGRTEMIPRPPTARRPLLDAMWDQRQKVEMKNSPAGMMATRLHRVARTWYISPSLRRTTTRPGCLTVTESAAVSSTPFP